MIDPRRRPGCSSEARRRQVRRKFPDSINLRNSINNIKKLSAEMARCFYRSVYINQTGRTQNEFAEPTHPDREADA